MHAKLNPNSCKKDSKNKNILTMESSNEIYNNLDLDDNISKNSVQKELNVSILYCEE